eukprot:scaffold733_cov267-Pinguiococcus_pyrenoidosus.AAC.41
MEPHRMTIRSQSTKPDPGSANVGVVRDRVEQSRMKSMRFHVAHDDLRPRASQARANHAVQTLNPISETRDDVGPNPSEVHRSLLPTKEIPKKAANSSRFSTLLKPTRREGTNGDRRKSLVCHWNVADLALDVFGLPDLSHRHSEPRQEIVSARSSKDRQTGTDIRQSA